MIAWDKGGKGMHGRKKRVLILIGGIFLSLIGLMGASSRTIAENDASVLIEESFLKVSYKTERTVKPRGEK